MSSTQTLAFVACPCWAILASSPLTLSTACLDMSSSGLVLQTSTELLFGIKKTYQLHERERPRWETYCFVSSDGDEICDM